MAHIACMLLAADMILRVPVERVLRRILLFTVVAAKHGTPQPSSFEGLRV